MRFIWTTVCFLALSFMTSIAQVKDGSDWNVVDNFLSQTSATSDTNKNVVKRPKLDLTPTALREPSRADGTQNSIIRPNSQKNPTVGSTGDISCTTDDGRPGEYVTHYLCDKNGVIIRDGRDIVSPRNTGSICCALGDTTDNEFDDEDDESTSKSPLTTTKPSPVPPMINKMNTDGCGWSNLLPAPSTSPVRPTSITESSFGEFPFMVAILTKGDTDVWSQDDYIGGGVLIDYRIVLTAAHKINKAEAKDLKCRAGEYNVQTETEIYPHQDRNVEKHIVHEQFYRLSLYYDVGLLFLERPFDPAPNIGLACLSSSFPTKIDDCYSMGWGRLIHNLGAFSQILKKVPLPLVVDPVECQRLLRKSRLGPYFQLHQTLTCAGGEKDIDTSQGDGGSPLVCAIDTNGVNKKYTVVGLTAYGAKNRHYSIPAVYVNVPFLYNWISTQLDNEKIEKKYI